MPCAHVWILKGACGTALSKPPMAMAIPRLATTLCVRKASTMANSGGTTLYHTGLGSRIAGAAKPSGKSAQRREDEPCRSGLGVFACSHNELAI